MVKGAVLSSICLRAPSRPQMAPGCQPTYRLHRLKYRRLLPRLPSCPALPAVQYGWGPDIYLRYSTLSKLYISPPDTRVGVEPVEAAQKFYAPPSPPSPPPSPPPT